MPADEAPCHLVGTAGHPKACSPSSHHCPPDFYDKTQCSAFDFERLGLRSAAMLISPLVEKGTVFQTPKRGPTPTSQFELTSVPATVKRLFNLTMFLTKRDAWAGSFDELLLESPRADTPLHLPTAPKNVTPWDPVPKSQHRRLLQQQDGTEAALARHCSSTGASSQICSGAEKASVKQRRQIELLSHLTQSPAPDLRAMDEWAARELIAGLWGQWLQTPPQVDAANADDGRETAGVDS